MYTETRHKAMVWIIFISIVITIYASYAESHYIWKMWSFLPISISVLYISGKSISCNYLKNGQGTHC